jgi:hypothetical protein
MRLAPMDATVKCDRIASVEKYFVEKVEDL